MLVYQEFKFIGFQKVDNLNFFPMFNNEKGSTITLPKNLINKKYISNFNTYSEQKSSLEKSGFFIILKEKMIEEKRLSSYLNYPTHKRWGFLEPFYKNCLDIVYISLNYRYK